MSDEVQVYAWGLALLASVWALVWFVFLRAFRGKESVAWMKGLLVRFWRALLRDFLANAARKMDDRKKEDSP